MIKYLQLKNILSHLLLITMIFFFPRIHLIAQVGNKMENEAASALLVKYLETGSLQFAEKIYETYPDSHYSKFCDACRFLDEDRKKALDLAETLVRDHPGFAPGHLILGTILSEGFGNHNRAIEQFSQAIEIKPDLNRAYRNRGIAYLGKEDYHSAWEDFNMLIERERGYAQGYLLRGIASHGMGDEKGLLTDFEIGLQIDYRALAPLFSSLGRTAVNKAIELAPENISYLYARGYAYFSEGQYRLASADFQHAIELVPGNPDFYKYSGACKMFLGDMEGAHSDLNIALGSNPEDPQTYYYLGLLMNDLENQPAKAYEYLSNAIELDRENADYYYQRSRSAYEMMNYRAARDDINMALMHNQRNGDFYALRGHIKIKLGTPPEDFCRDYQKAEQLGTGYNLRRILRKSCR